jgi:hypothetical protein
VIEGDQPGAVRIQRHVGGGLAARDPGDPGLIWLRALGFMAARSHIGG